MAIIAMTEPGQSQNALTLTTTPHRWQAPTFSRFFLTHCWPQYLMTNLESGDVISIGWLFKVLFLCFLELCFLFLCKTRHMVLKCFFEIFLNLNFWIWVVWYFDKVNSEKSVENGPWTWIHAIPLKDLKEDMGFWFCLGWPLLFELLIWIPTTAHRITMEDGPGVWGPAAMEEIHKHSRILALLWPGLNHSSHLGNETKEDLSLTPFL